MGSATCYAFVSSRVGVYDSLYVSVSELSVVVSLSVMSCVVSVCDVSARVARPGVVSAVSGRCFRYGVLALLLPGAWFHRL